MDGFNRLSRWFNWVGGKLKEVGTTSWNSPNKDATNTSLFTALPGGYRNSDGNYYYIGYLVVWWSSTEDNAGSAWARDVDYDDGNAGSSSSNKEVGFSVRCLRD
jgi:uncharacterized protein (TIGR02145 family)